MRTLLVAVLATLATSSTWAQSDQSSADRQLDLLAVEYRVAVYQRFHTDRAEYDLRRDLVRRLMDDWAGSPKTEEQRAAVAAWLRTAKETVTSESPTMPPELPDLPEAVAKTSADAEAKTSSTSVPSDATAEGTPSTADLPSLDLNGPGDKDQGSPILKPSKSTAAIGRALWKGYVRASGG